jgi:hypothetical protein
VLPVDSKLQPGSVAAFIAGSLAVILGSDIEPVRVLLLEPGIVVIGLAVAGGIGGGLGLKVVQGPLVEVIGIAIAYGALVPMIAGAVIALPVAPIAAAFGVVAWPVTIPTALAWLALVRWDRSRERLSTAPTAGAAVILATALLVIRFTQPAATMSAGAGQCVTFPGESIATIAWSPDAQWLGVGSESDGGGIVRVIEQDSNKISELARGPFVVPSSGVAVGPGGETTYLVYAQGVTAAEEDGAQLWRASPTAASSPFADLPTPGLVDLTWTPDGVAAVQWVDPVTWTETHRLVWVRPNATAADVFDPIAPDGLLRHPVLALMADPSRMEPITLRTPSGDRTIEWPEDASDGASVTGDGAFLVFHVGAFTAEWVDEEYGQVVGQSTETGQRVVLLQGEGRAPKLAAGRLAYLTPGYPENTVCMKPVTAVTE